MNIHGIGSGYIVSIDSDELWSHGIDPEHISDFAAEELLREVLERTGRGASEMEVEIYEGRGGIILAVSMKRRTEYYSFSESEALLSAAAVIPDQCSRLFYYDGRYILALMPQGEEKNSSASEFGERIDVPEGFLLHLSEHGKLICGDDAIMRLKSVFLRAG